MTATDMAARLRSIREEWRAQDGTGVPGGLHFISGADLTAAADEIDLLREHISWWEDIARRHGYCFGCGAPDGYPHHVYGMRKCCPDCSHTRANTAGAAEVTR